MGSRLRRGWSERRRCHTRGRQMAGIFSPYVNYMRQFVFFRVSGSCRDRSDCSTIGTDVEIGAISEMVHLYSRATSRREATVDSLRGLAGLSILNIAANRLSEGNSSVPGSLPEPGKAGLRGSPQLTGGPRFPVAVSGQRGPRARQRSSNRNKQVYERTEKRARAA